jgi:hypothetical protein
VTKKELLDSAAAVAVVSSRPTRPGSFKTVGEGWPRNIKGLTVIRHWIYKLSKTFLCKSQQKKPRISYLWVPNALLPEGLAVMEAWGFKYKSNIIWYKICKDGGPDGRGVGFYFRNVTEVLLFGVL